MNDIDGLHGAFTYRTMRAAIGDSRLRAAIDAGRLVGFGRGVILDGARALELRTRCAGALLLAGPSAVVVGPSAAALHGCTAVGGHPVHVSIPDDRRVASRNGLVVHQGGVAAAEITRIERLRVVTLPVAVGEVLCSAARRAALACADEALRLVDDPAQLWLAIGEYLKARPDTRGLRQASDLLRLATGRPESPAESALLLTLVDNGLPEPLSQYEVFGDSADVLWRLDFAWPEALIGVQYEPVARKRLAADMARESSLRRQGWTVVRAGPEDLASPGALCDRIRHAFTERRNAA
jgi:hypothetical protein